MLYVAFNSKCPLPLGDQGFQSVRRPRFVSVMAFDGFQWKIILDGLINQFIEGINFGLTTTSISDIPTLCLYPSAKRSITRVFHWSNRSSSHFVGKLDTFGYPGDTIMITPTYRRRHNWAIVLVCKVGDD